VAIGLAGNGDSGTITRTGPCSVKEKEKKSCHEDHPDWPVNYVHLSLTPTIGAHIAAAQAAGYPDGLTYLGPNNPLQGINRSAACPPGIFSNIGMSCDEYPYASTAQGGAGASIAPVPVREQRIQGAQLGGFGGFYNSLAPGEEFCVEVVP
jgi:Deoxyribonuclease NucA/NucB